MTATYPDISPASSTCARARASAWSRACGAQRRPARRWPRATTWRCSTASTIPARAERDNYADDGFHPSEEGHRRAAMECLRSLRGRLREHAGAAWRRPDDLRSRTSTPSRAASASSRRAARSASRTSWSRSRRSPATCIPSTWTPTGLRRAASASASRTGCSCSRTRSGLVPFDPERVVALRACRRRRRSSSPSRSATPCTWRARSSSPPELDDEHGLVECRWKVVNQQRERCCECRIEVVWRRGEPAVLAAARASIRPDLDMLLEGKRLLITGVLTSGSIALLRGRARPAGGRGDRADRLRPHPADDRARGEEAAATARGARARREQSADFERAGRRARLSAGAASTARCTRSPSRPATRSAASFMSAPPESAVDRVPDQRVLASRRSPRLCCRFERRGWSGRGHGLRRLRRMAGLRLDGRGEGGSRVGLALPRARPRALGRAREPRVRRAGRDAGRGRHPRLRRGLAGLWGEQAPLGWDTGDPAAVADTVLLPALRPRHAGSPARSCTWTAASTRWARRSPQAPEQ